MKSLYRCTVQTNRFLTPTTFELTFTSDVCFAWEAGQFISIIIPGAGPNGRDLRRAYSFASPPHIQPIELCIKWMPGGPGSTYLSQLKSGDTFQAMAPYGDFIFSPKEGSSLCLIGTGTGIAPFRSILFSEKFYKFPPLQTLCLFGARSEEDRLYPEEFSKRTGIQWVEMLSQPSSNWKGRVGRVGDYMRSLDVSFPWLTTDYYLCGNGAMIREVKEFLIQVKGVDKKAIHQEAYYPGVSSSSGG